MRESDLKLTIFANYHSFTTTLRLYIQFDNQTNYYGTFKVETVGDAYIVIAGVPEQIDDHADRIVEMGLAMVHVTRTIYSPADGKHIEVCGI